MNKKEQPEIKLTANVNLNDTNNYQLLLASQNYGTFYCIYGKLTITEGTKILEKIDLKLKNYKGTCNVGFINNDSSLNHVRVYRHEKTLFIEIPVMGFCNAPNSEINQTNATSGKQIDLTGVEKIFIYRGIIKNNSMVGNISDAEFIYRDGEDRRPRYQKLPNGMYNSLDDWDLKTPFLSGAKASGGNCFTSNLEVYP